MSNPMFSLENFTSFVGRNNFARVNRFEAMIQPPLPLRGKWGSRLRDLSMLIEDTAFPGKTLETAKLRIHALSEQRARVADYFGEAINFTFYMDSAWDMKSFFEDWQNIIIGRSREVGFYKDYVGEVIIRALDVNDTIMHSVILEEAFPRSFQLTQVAHGANAVQRFVVAMAFKRWATTYFASDTPQAAPSAEDEAATNNSIIQATMDNRPLDLSNTPDDLFGTI